MFRIEFVVRDARDAGYLWRAGRIVLDAHEQRFRSLIHDWTETDYERQWFEALTSITHGDAHSCLVTVVPPIASREMAVVWPLQRHGDDVKMRKTAFLPDDVPTFDRSVPSSFVSESDFADDGLAEWRFAVRDAEQFLRSNKPHPDQ